jgi:hypothetical protein
MDSLKKLDDETKAELTNFFQSHSRLGLVYSADLDHDPLMWQVVLRDLRAARCTLTELLELLSQAYAEFTADDGAMASQVLADAEAAAKEHDAKFGRVTVIERDPPFLPTVAAHAAYIDWARRHDIWPKLTRREFVEQMEAKFGIEQTRRKCGRYRDVRGFEGWALNEAWRHFDEIASRSG